MDAFTGEYAAYITPAFAVCALVGIWMIADSLLRARKWRREAERLAKDVGQQ